MRFPSARAAIVEYNFTLRQLLGTHGDGFESGSLSPDCSDIYEQNRWLNLVGEEGKTSSLPGPKIEAFEGDIIRVNVQNENEAVAATIHWHGIHQKGTVWSDGAAQITQCSLGPFESQTYEFIAYPSGTHYYHSHQGLTASDGLVGALIVHPKEPEPFEYDEERDVFLMDYFSSTSLQRRAGLAAPEFKWIGNPDSLLLNGRGLSKTCRDFNGVQPIQKCFDDCNDESTCLLKCAQQPGMPACLDSCNNELYWTPSILIEKGKTYRFRIVNAGGLIMQNLAIKNHNMIVVEADGTYVDPVNVTNLNVAPGERYSVLVTGDQDGDNFWMQTVFAGRNGNGQATGNFILSYANTTDAVELPPSDEFPDHPDWNDFNSHREFLASLQTLNPSAYPEEQRALRVDDADIERYILTLTQGYNPDVYKGELYWAINNISFAYPNNGVPLLYSAVEETKRLGWPLPEGEELMGTIDLPRENNVSWNLSAFMEPTPGLNISETKSSVIRLNQNDVAEFVIENSVGVSNVSEFHPWHFHGHSYWVVGRGKGAFNETEDVPKYNLRNPVLRDTTVGISKEWVAVRFVANNPGVWYFHCHTRAHLSMGMGFVVIVSPNNVGIHADALGNCAENGIEKYVTSGTESEEDIEVKISRLGSQQGTSSGGSNQSYPLFLCLLVTLSLTLIMHA